MTRPQHPTSYALLTGLVAGVVGTTAKARAEGFLQPRAEKFWPPTDHQKANVQGADPADHPDNMPPTLVAERAADAVGQDPDDDAIAKAAMGLHQAMGVGSAVAYSLLAHRVPAVRVGFGAPAGLVLYAATHGSALPGTGFQPWPWQMPRAAVAWEAGSHLVYGAVVDVVLRVFDVARR